MIGDTTMNENRVWLITGASSGFGRAIAEAALDRGDRVVATARDPGQLSNLAADDGVHVIALDVTDAEQRLSAVDQAVRRFGRIDVLVNNAGRTQVGAVEETTDDELRSLFELHFFAPVALTRAVLPHMRARGGGAIVQMSSVGGQITAPGFGAYCATKFALEGITQALHDEVAPFGIRTLIVEPGAFRTGLFRPDAAYQSPPMPAYAQTVGPTRDYVSGGHGLQPGDPAKAAQAILAALDADEPPLRLVLGGDAIDNIRARLEQLTGELGRWEEVGRGTAIDGA
jgi:NAD(P)-dependent dehydrogenase (short-subunit alcohol dehydrogenase family)